MWSRGLHCTTLLNELGNLSQCLYHDDNIMNTYYIVTFWAYALCRVLYKILLNVYLFLWFAMSVVGCTCTAEPVLLSFAYLHHRNTVTFLFMGELGSVCDVKVIHVTSCISVWLGSSANHFFHRPFPFLPDWFHGLSDHLMILFCSTAGFVCMVC